MSPYSNPLLLGSVPLHLTGTLMQMAIMRVPSNPSMHQVVLIESWQAEDGTDIMDSANFNETWADILKYSA